MKEIQNILNEGIRALEFSTSDGLFSALNLNNTLDWYRDRIDFPTQVKMVEK